MTDQLNAAVAMCKTIMRNGLDAYVINARLQRRNMNEETPELDICSEADLEELQKLFPGTAAPDHEAEPSVVGVLEQNGARIRFYRAEVEEGAHLDECVARLTPRLIKELDRRGKLEEYGVSPALPKPQDDTDGLDFSEGVVRIRGLPDQTLKRNLLRVVKALRYSADHHMPIEENSWMAILRNGKRMLDYVPVSEIMAEWRQVHPENMHEFVRLLYESMILHSLIPEVATTARIRQKKNESEEESVFDHILAVMARYPEELPYDWFGTLACMLHDVGKTFTAEYLDGRWSFYQHHRVGAKIARKIMRRLGFEPGEVDLVCHLIRHHMRFHFMLTDKGVRRFKALDEYPRLIEMVRADIKARGGQYKEFNHNLKMLERTEIPEEVLEPFLNGNQIMQLTGLPPGPAVGKLREMLRRAQEAGDVKNPAEAEAWVKDKAAGAK